MAETVRCRYRRRMTPISFKRHRFPPVIIQHAVWLYTRFTLSFRDVEELLAERGIDVSNETVRRWFLKFGRLIARNLRRSRPRASVHWHLDEMVIKIRNRKYWLWRAVDNEGEVLDFLVQRRRCVRSARKLLRKLLKKQGSRRSASPRTGSNRTPSPSAKSGYPRSMIRGCGQTTGPKTPTSPFDDESDNSSDPSRPGQPNVSWQSTPPFRTPSASNAISCHAASSRRFGPRRLRSGGRAASQPNPTVRQLAADYRS